LPIPINIGLTDNLIDFFVGKIISLVQPQLRRLDEFISIPIKDLESLHNFFFTVSVPVSVASREHSQELGEIESTISVRVVKRFVEKTRLPEIE